MNRLFHSRITSDAFDRWFSWVVGFVLLALATTLVLRALSGLDLPRSVILVSGVAVAWLTMGRLFPGRAEVGGGRG